VALVRPALRWHRQGACHGWPQDWWFPPENVLGAARTALEDQAKAVCRRCPVRTCCLAAGLQTPAIADIGVWGATTPKERVRLRRQLTAEHGTAILRSADGLLWAWCDSWLRQGDRPIRRARAQAGARVAWGTKRGEHADRDRFIAKLRDDGATLETIAAEVGCSTATVHRVLGTSPVRRPRGSAGSPGGAKREQALAVEARGVAARALVNAGMTMSAAAAKLGVSRRTVRLALIGREGRHELRELELERRLDPSELCS
jgi:WhiB family transcriptional regulator, redox-sensing transcriptional regulator